MWCIPSKPSERDPITESLRALKTLRCEHGRVSVDPLEVIDRPGYREARAAAARLIHDLGRGLTFSSDEARGLAKARFPLKPYCLVKDWMVLRLKLNDEQQAKVEAAGCLPLVLFAFCVVEDSRGRSQPGHWVRSSMCRSFTEGVLFETRNATYVLVGAGDESESSLEAASLSSEAAVFKFLTPASCTAAGRWPRTIGVRHDPLSETACD